MSVWIEQCVVVVGALVAVLNLGMIGYFWWLVRRARRLEHLLACICIRAFFYQQQMPVWRAWCAATGYTFRLVGPAGEERAW